MDLQGLGFRAHAGFRVPAKVISGLALHGFL